MAALSKLILESLFRWKFAGHSRVNLDASDASGQPYRVAEKRLDDKFEKAGKVGLGERADALIKTGQFTRHGIFVEHAFCDAPMEFRHSNFEGSLCCILIAACDGFLYFADVSPDTADARAISCIATFRLAHALACRYGMGHGKT
jgi:hypothetical protein